jgi:hypothetical protein
LKLTLLREGETLHEKKIISWVAFDITEKKMLSRSFQLQRILEKYFPKDIENMIFIYQLSLSFMEELGGFKPPIYKKCCIQGDDPDYGVTFCRYLEHDKRIGPYDDSSWSVAYPLMSPGRLSAHKE